MSEIRTFHPSSPLFLFLFLLIIIAVISAFLAGIHRANRGATALATPRTLKVTLGLVVWLSGISGIVASGTLSEGPMPRLIVFFGLINLSSISFALSPAGRWLATGLSIGQLIAFQTFRLPLEFVLHEWSLQGVIPTTLTWSGSNLDWIVGTAAGLTAPFAAHHPRVAWGFNFIGLASLLNVMRVAVLSSPLPFAWLVHPPLLLVFHLPYALILPICVGGALAGHIVLTRSLLRLPIKGDLH